MLLWIFFSSLFFLVELQTSAEKIQSCAVGKKINNVFNHLKRNGFCYLLDTKMRDT